MSGASSARDGAPSSASENAGAAARRGGFLPVQVGPDGTDWARADDGLPVEVLGARICALATRMAQATFHWLQMIAEFDERDGWAGVGIRSCAHWLAWTCSMAGGTAREHVRVARALRGLPLVGAEMAAGRLSYAKVREITRIHDRVDEATLVDLARTATASQLARTVRGFRRSDGERLEQELRRRVSWRVDDDGSVVLSARLPGEEGAAVIAALEAARDDLIRLSGREKQAGGADRAGETGNRDALVGDAAVGGAGDSGAGDGGAEGGAGGDAGDGDAGDGVTNGVAERGGNDDGEQSVCRPGEPYEPVDPADMLLQWARGYLSAAPQDRSGEDRTVVLVHVNAEHLLDGRGADASAIAGPDERVAQDVAGPRDPDIRNEERSRGNAFGTAVPTDCCEVAGVSGIAGSTAARLACDATVAGILRDGSGVVLAHGRRRRTVSSAQRRLLAIRDGACRFPSCTRTSHLEAHHVRHWMHGGRTDPDNLILLCRFHHMACHEGGVVIGYALDSRPGAPRWHFTTRDGQTMRGDRLPSGAPGWQGDEWILWRGLDGSLGRQDPEAERILPRWAGEPFSLADAVAVLFGSPRDPSAPMGDADASERRGRDTPLAA